MTQLQLNPAQAEALRQTLSLVLSELSYEIANTDSKRFRDGLKERRERLREVFALVGGETGEATEAQRL